MDTSIIIIISFPHTITWVSYVCSSASSLIENQCLLYSVAFPGLTPTAMKKSRPFQVDLLEGRQTTGDVSWRNKPSSTDCLEVDKYLHESHRNWTFN